MNGINFINKQNLNDDYMTDNKSNLRHIIWADSNPYQQIPISVIDLDRDLFFKQNIKPVVSHQQKRPLKSCIKTNKKYDMAPGIEKEEKMNRAPNNVNNNIINNLIKRNLINNNVNNNQNSNYNLVEKISSHIVLSQNFRTKKNKKI